VACKGRRDTTLFLLRCVLLDSAENLLRDDDWNGHAGANSKAYIAAVWAIITGVAGGKDRCDLDDKTLRDAIDKVKNSPDPAIKGSLDKVKAKIKDALKKKAELAKEAAEKILKEAGSGLPNGSPEMPKAGKKTFLRRIPWLGNLISAGGIKGNFDRARQDGLDPIRAGILGAGGLLSPFDYNDMNDVGDAIGEFFGGPSSIEPNSNP
jgi:hypothetical protein